MLTSINGLQAAQTLPALAPLPKRADVPVSLAITELSPADSVQRTTAVGAIPATLSFFAYPAASLDKALAQLVSSPTEESYRKAQAGFRIALRGLDLKALQELQPALDAQIKAQSEYRNQKFLADIQVDLYMEIHAKGGKPNMPALTMPPSPGNGPDGVFAGSLRQLALSPSEANYRTARAGFRVALRSLSVEDLNKTRALAQAAISTSSDYRTQVFLDDMLEDIVMEQFERGMNPAAPALVKPPALGKSPAEIAANGLKLLNSNASEATYRTAIAAVRVAARDLDKAQQAALKAELTKAMGSTSDYRTQIFLDQVARELF